ncbi:MAG: hypothetical protein ACI4OU_04385 [Candidatus Enterenecus sp.]
MIKKALAAALCAAWLLMSLCACGQSNANNPSNAIFTANSSNLGCTPQELIDYINGGIDYAIEHDGDKSLRTIPSTDNCDDFGNLRISDITLYLKIETDDAGKLTEIQICNIPRFGGTTENVAAYLYLIACAYAVTDDVPDILTDHENALIEGSVSGYDVIYDGVKYSFACAATTLHTVTITPAP